MFRHQINAVLLLAAFLSLSALASCGDAATSTTPAETVSDNTAVTEASETQDPDEAALTNTLASLPEQDYGGYTFTIMDRDISQNAIWGTIDVYASEETGDPINDAVYKRNQLLEEKYNIIIAENGQLDVAGSASKLILAGDDSVDLVTDGLNALASKTSSHLFHNLKNINGLNLDGEWWDQRMNTDFCIDGNVFFATGDISIMDNEGTWCILFNKQIASDYDVENLYTAVEEGTWTLDKMYDIMKLVTKDLDGDGTLSVTDQWGYEGETFNTYALWCGCGNQIASISKDGTGIDITIDTERAASAYDKVMEMQTDKSCSALVAVNTFTSFDEYYASFKAGLCMFQYGAMSLIMDYRDTDVNFGILPAPKYDEAQEQYYNTFSFCNMTAYAIPITASDTDRTGTIMEAMAEISQYVLTPAYYDVSLKGKFTRDEESADMIDLILNTRSYDLGSVFQFGGGFTMLNTASANKIGTYSSQCAKVISGMQKAIDKYLTALQEQE